MYCGGETLYKQETRSRGATGRRLWERNLLFEGENRDAGVGTFELSLFHCSLRGGGQDGIASHDLRFADTAGSGKLKLESDGSADFHAVGKLWIGDFYITALGFADRILSIGRDDTEEKNRKRR